MPIYTVDPAILFFTIFLWEEYKKLHSKWFRKKKHTRKIMEEIEIHEKYENICKKSKGK